MRKPYWSANHGNLVAVINHHFFLELYFRHERSMMQGFLDGAINAGLETEIGVLLRHETLDSSPSSKTEFQLSGIFCPASLTRAIASIRSCRSTSAHLRSLSLR